MLTHRLYHNSVHFLLQNNSLKLFELIQNDHVLIENMNLSNISILFDYNTHRIRYYRQPYVQHNITLFKYPFIDLRTFMNIFKSMEHNYVEIIHPINKFYLIFPSVSHTIQNSFQVIEIYLFWKIKKQPIESIRCILSQFLKSSIALYQIPQIITNAFEDTSLESSNVSPDIANLLYYVCTLNIVSNNSLNYLANNKYLCQDIRNHFIQDNDFLTLINYQTMWVLTRNYKYLLSETVNIRSKLFMIEMIYDNPHYFSDLRNIRYGCGEVLHINNVQYNTIHHFDNNFSILLPFIFKLNCTSFIRHWIIHSIKNPNMKKVFNAVISNDDLELFKFFCGNDFFELFENNLRDGTFFINSIVQHYLTKNSVNIAFWIYNVILDSYDMKIDMIAMLIKCKMFRIIYEFNETYEYLIEDDLFDHNELHPCDKCSKKNKDIEDTHIDKKQRVDDNKCTNMNVHLEKSDGFVDTILLGIDMFSQKFNNIRNFTIKKITIEINKDYMTILKYDTCKSMHNCKNVVDEYKRELDCVVGNIEELSTCTLMNKCLIKYFGHEHVNSVNTKKLPNSKHINYYYVYFDDVELLKSSLENMSFVHSTYVCDLIYFSAKTMSKKSFCYLINVLGKNIQDVNLKNVVDQMVNNVWKITYKQTIWFIHELFRRKIMSETQCYQIALIYNNIDFLKIMFMGVSDRYWDSLELITMLFEHDRIKLLMEIVNSRINTKYFEKVVLCALETKQNNICTEYIIKNAYRSGIVER